MKTYYKIDFFSDEGGEGEFYVIDNGTHYNMVTPSGVEHSLSKFDFYRWIDDNEIGVVTKVGDSFKPSTYKNYMKRVKL